VGAVTRIRAASIPREAPLQRLVPPRNGRQLGTGQGSGRLRLVLNEQQAALGDFPGIVGLVQLLRAARGEAGIDPLEAAGDGVGGAGVNLYRSEPVQEQGLAA